MRRRDFVAGAVASAALPGFARAASLDGVLRRSIASIPGITAVYAHDMSLGQAIFSHNATQPFPAASTIKLLIMLTAFQLEDASPGTLHAPVRIHRSDLVGGSEFLARAGGGERYSVGELVRPMITVSDNSAANALITHFGFDAINASARRARMRATHLRRHFLDYSAIVRHHENVTTAADMGRLLYQLERGSRESLHTVASPPACRTMIEILLGQTDRDKIPAGVPSGVPVANKTGEVDGVRNDVAIVDPFGDSPYVLTVLTKNVGDYARATSGITHISRAMYRRFVHTNA